MASVTNHDIFETLCEIEVVDLRAIALRNTARPLKTPGQSDISIVQYHPDLGAITGPQPTFSLLLSTWESSGNCFFHEACVYLPAHDELYITSNLLQSASSAQHPVVIISRLQLARGPAPGGAVESVAWQKLRPPPNMPMPASGATYRYGILFCSQGTTAPGTGGLFYMPRGQRPEPVVTNFFGRDFNSVHSVAVARDGSLWFTDPCHGFEKEFRQRPQLPSQIYRYDPATGDLRVMADGLDRPHGIALSPDESTVYVTDTDAVCADGTQDPGRAATIYAFDVMKRFSSPFLANKRVFAYALAGVPKGLVCDNRGNVYAGCADGVEIWNAGGTILGVIEVPGGVTSMSFGRGGELFLCAEQRLWRVRIGVEDWAFSGPLSPSARDFH
ncbi:D-lactonohydrolase-like protein-like protein [Cercophora scortea]|uniref:D-lactonohydrolase-like protein-like protein n=1 Tax=Cercophora scortea TaxID=314031 RepID=A0AAE0IGV0_9PEZI|nr:D-lactonohydrolase-like protein-like protein [Cercophora scortea]